MDVTKVTVIVERTRGGKTWREQESTTVHPQNGNQRKELVQILLAMARACAPRTPKQGAKP